MKKFFLNKGRKWNKSEAKRSPFGFFLFDGVREEQTSPKILLLLSLFLSIGVKYIWTSGRLCNFDGCDRPDFFPKHVNGWFWSANQARLSATNSTTGFHDWSFTGG